MRVFQFSFRSTCNANIIFSLIHLLTLHYVGLHVTVPQATRNNMIEITKNSLEHWKHQRSACCSINCLCQLSVFVLSSLDLHANVYMHVNRLHLVQTTDVVIVVTADNSTYLHSVRRDCTSYLSARKWLSYLPTELVTAVLTHHDGEGLSVGAESFFTKLKKFT